MDRVRHKIIWEERSWTTNSERRMHPMQRASLIKKWRNAFAILAIEAKIPKLIEVEIIVTPFAKDRRWMQDTTACHPAYKAAQDGLIDAGVLSDDSPDIVIFVGFHAPVVCGTDGLELEISGIPQGDAIPPPIVVPIQKKTKPTYNNGRRKKATKGASNGSTRRRSSVQKSLGDPTVVRAPQKRS